MSSEEGKAVRETKGRREPWEGGSPRAAVGRFIQARVGHVTLSRVRTSQLALQRLGGKPQVRWGVYGRTGGLVGWKEVSAVAPPSHTFLLAVPSRQDPDCSAPRPDLRVLLSDKKQARYEKYDKSPAQSSQATLVPLCTL
jgi:hypothetical protein